MNEQLTGQIIKAALRVHSILGPGLLEHAYRVCLVHELRKRGLKIRTEVPVPILYDGVVIDTGFRLGVLVEEVVVVELKTVTKLTDLNGAQLLSHLRLDKKPTGLLINFHVTRLRNGIRRISN